MGFALDYTPTNSLSGAGGYPYHTNNGVIAEAYERNNLKVTGGNGVTYVSPGKALLRSTVYENDETVTLVHDSTAGFNRYDAIVLHIAGSTLTLQIVKGSEGTQPAYPAIVDSIPGVSYYLLLAYVYIAHPFTTEVTAIPDTSIQDQRKFIETSQSYTLDYGSKHNFIYNSELAVYSAASGTDSLGLPEGWAVETNAIVTTRYANSASDMPRGYVCGWRADTGAVIYTQTHTPSGLTRTWGTTTSQIGIPVAALLRMKLTTGKRIAIRLQSRSYETTPVAWVTIAETYYTYNATTGAWFNVILRGITSGPYIGFGTTSLRIEIEDLTPAVTTEIYFSYCSAVFGYVPIYYYKQSEIVMLKNPLYAYYDGTFRTSSETHSVIEADVAGIAHDLRYALLDIRYRDSGSAANYVYVGTDHGVYQGKGAPNDTFIRQFAWQPISGLSTTTLFTANIYASGANTLEAAIRIAGVVT